MLAITDPDDAYELHMNLIAHGRRGLPAAAALRGVRAGADVRGPRGRTVDAGGLTPSGPRSAARSAGSIRARDGTGPSRPPRQ